jgi:hypothetical protein
MAVARGFRQEPHSMLAASYTLKYEPRLKSLPGTNTLDYLRTRGNTLGCMAMARRFGQEPHSMYAHSYT